MEISDSKIITLKKEVNKVLQVNSLILETKKLIKPLQDRLKQLKTEKKELEKDICPTLNEYKLKIVELPNDGFMEHKVRQAMVPMTQKSIKERMQLFFSEGPGHKISFNSKKADEKAHELFDFIYGKENREHVQKEELVIKI